MLDIVNEETKTNQYIQDEYISKICKCMTIKEMQDYKGKQKNTTVDVMQ